jgi:hypothetical protein
MSVDLKMVSIPPAKGPLNNRENDDKPLDLGTPFEGQNQLVTRYPSLLMGKDFREKSQSKGWIETLLRSISPFGDKVFLSGVSFRPNGTNGSKWLKIGLSTKQVIHRLVTQLGGRLPDCFIPHYCPFLSYSQPTNHRSDPANLVKEHIPKLTKVKQDHPPMLGHLSVSPAAGKSPIKITHRSFFQRSFDFLAGHVSENMFGSPISLQS